MNLKPSWLQSNKRCCGISYKVQCTRTLCTMYSLYWYNKVQCTRTFCTVYKVQCTCTFCTVYTVHCTKYNLLVHSVQCTKYNVLVQYLQCTKYNVLIHSVICNKKMLLQPIIFLILTHLLSNSLAAKAGVFGPQKLGVYSDTLKVRVSSAQRGL